MSVSIDWPRNFTNVSKLYPQNMKLTTALFFILLSFAAHSQSYDVPNPSTGLAMGLSGGYASTESMIGTFSIGAMLETNNHVSVNMILLNELQKTDVPSIGEARIGHLFSTWEFYGGVGYHLAGSDNKISSNPNTGIRPALGIIKHFNSSPWTISASMSGKIFSLQLGLFGVR
ncbi:MAG: hypothetical protein M3040_17030 [Bacteroidota bacterium]|nr:hypothetical protein [Bacteroidota bacterium]